MSPSALRGPVRPDGDRAGDARTVRRPHGGARRHSGAGGPGVPAVREMARPERFELPTPWFVAKYSIQLSYGRVRERDYRGSPARGRVRSVSPACLPPRYGGSAHRPLIPFIAGGRVRQRPRGARRCVMRRDTPAAKPSLEAGARWRPDQQLPLTRRSMSGGFDSAVISGTRASVRGDYEARSGVSRNDCGPVSRSRRSGSIAREIVTSRRRRGCRAGRRRAP